MVFEAVIPRRAAAFHLFEQPRLPSFPLELHKMKDVLHPVAPSLENLDFSSLPLD